MSQANGGQLKIFAGSSARELSSEIAAYLGMPLGRIELGTFANGEIKVIVNENVRGNDIFVVQSTCSPVNDHLMELLIIIDALMRASARRVTAVVPYYGYARQDRKTRGREPITAKLVANLITTAGAGRVLTMDLHAGQIQGFFDIPVDHLSAVPILADYFLQKGIEDVVVVSPDLGSLARARDMAVKLRAPIAIVDKRRPEPNVAEVMNIVGRVKGKTAIIIDDMIDTAGSLVSAVDALLDRGAKQVYGCCTHPVLSPPAVERINGSRISEVVVTNTIPLGADKSSGKIRVLSVARLLGEAISRIHEDLSVSELFV
ncbi:MAG: ribose-phosphate pyrophosphokinase [Firmicutes bacterium]|jgi:ribose-phosphate pyrophosphokinase|nr:ribose-phosphate pyrophosphokinase [Bacillota bacterium]